MSNRVSVAVRTGAAAFEKITVLVTLTLLCVGVYKFNLAPQAAQLASAPIMRFAVRTASVQDVTPMPSLFDRESAMNAGDLLNRWAPFVTEASKRFDVPESWIRAVIRQESGGRTVTHGDIPITSKAGAIGLMQVMPDTYEDMRAAYNLGSNPYDAHDNIIAGTAYLRWLHGRYGFPKMFAAYNDGPGNFDDYVSGKRTLPAETVNYLADLSAELSPGRTRHSHTV